MFLVLCCLVIYEEYHGLSLHDLTGTLLFYFILFFLEGVVDRTSKMAKTTARQNVYVGGYCIMDKYFLQDI
jgi:hypothetical protein